MPKSQNPKIHFGEGLGYMLTNPELIIDVFVDGHP